jgi:hypothetical protein
MDFKERENYADELQECYMNFDHFRLMKSNEFIEFVKERILFLIDIARYESALLKVKNILAILNEKVNFYWYSQFQLLKAMCLRGLRDYKSAHEILKTLLPAVSDNKTKLRDWKMFVDLHFQFGIFPFLFSFDILRQRGPPQHNEMLEVHIDVILRKQENP